MLQKMEILAVHSTMDDTLKKYVERKIGRVDRFLPKTVRESAHATIRLCEEKATAAGRHFKCEVTLHLPHQTITLTESTVNMYAAVDIIEAKLKAQIKKYKDLHTNAKLHRRLMARFSGSVA